MTWEFPLYIIPSVLAMALTGVFALLVWQRRPISGLNAFIWLMLAGVIWSLAYAVEVGASDLGTKTFCAKIQYVSIVCMPVAWLVFVLQYTGQSKWLTRRNLVLLAVIPLLTVLLALTDEVHGLFFGDLRIEKRGSLTVLVRSFGHWFWIHTGYGLTLLFLGTAFLTKALFRDPEQYRGQVVPLVVATLAPWAGSAVYVFGLRPLHLGDITPFAFTLSGLAIMWGLIRGRLLDIVPMAYDAVIAGMGDGVISLDSKDCILDLNPTAKRILGRRVDKGQTAAEVFSQWPDLLKRYKDVEADHSEIVLEKGAGRRHFLLRMWPLYGRGHVMGRVLALRDVTGRKVAEEALRDSEERFRSLSDAAEEGIAIHDKEVIVDANQALERMLQYEYEELIGMPLEKLFTPETWKIVLGKMGKGSDTACEGYGVRKDGSSFHCQLVVKPYRYGGETRWVAAFRDISEQKKLQAQLQHAQKMESIGTIASGVSHNFRNILAGISVNTQLIQIKYRQDTALQETAERISRNVSRGARLVEGLMQFARKKTEMSFTTLDLSEVIQEVYQLVTRSFDKRIKILFQVPPPPLPIVGDHSGLSQVFMNLCTNARDAMPDGGELLIRVEKTPDEAVVTVSDTGHGMSQETLEKCFDPFFTTKDGLMGTGLGLSTAYSIVREHDGDIQVTSQPDKGTVFTVRIPLADIQEEEAGIYAGELARGRGEKVLIVDDEREFLESMSELLSELGYEVETASNGRDAINKHAVWRPAVVLLDRNMPEMDGAACAARIRVGDPSARIVLISGYEETGPDGIDEKTRAVIKGYLTKPLDLVDLTHLLARILRHGSSI